jgi:Zn-dependent protease with chaperone function
MTTQPPAPAPRPRRTFPEIAAVSWEHPADRAALQTLRSVPGFEEVIRKILAFLGGERGIRLLFQANAVRVGPTQFPKLWTTHVEVCTTFDWPTVPELYVSQTPVFNAGAYGVDSPFIVLHSAALELLDDDEVRVMLAHELGHVMSGHAFYRTIAAILFLISASALPALAGIALLPVRLAFLEWSRKSELSADRAGMLGGQDPVASQGLFMKMAGGVRPPYQHGELDLNTFMAQAHEYVGSNEGLDVLYKLLSTLLLSHPMHTVRAAELQTWIAGGDYDRIVRGEYARRGPETTDRPLREDIQAATQYYTAEAKETFGQVVDAAKKAADKAKEAFRRTQKT